MEARYDLHTLARALAKIAHGFAVAQFGIDGFRPCLPKLILGEYWFAPFFVGGEMDDPPPPIDQMHEVVFGTLPTNVS